MALDDYFTDPSQECLARLFDAVNAMDMSQAPSLTRDEKLILRVTDRKEVFLEKFPAPAAPAQAGPGSAVHQGQVQKRPSQASTHAHGGYRDRGGGGGERDKDREALVMHALEGGSSTSFEGGRAPSQSQSQSRSRANSLRSHKSAATDASGGPASYGSSAAWAGEDGVLEGPEGRNQTTPQPPQSQSAQRGRRSTDSNSTNSHARKEEATIPLIGPNSRGLEDTHFFKTSIVYRGHTLPIKMPLSTFAEEVGDVSSIHILNFNAI